MMLSHRCLCSFVGVLSAAAVIGLNRSAAAELQPQIALPAVTPPQAVFDFHNADAYPVMRAVSANRLTVMMNQKETTVCLAGVDRPDTSGLTQETADTFDTVANRFVNDLLQGESVYLALQSQRDGELMAYVFRAPDGLFVDAELIRQGLGQTAPLSDDRFVELFRYCQARARQTQKGFWKVQPASLEQSRAIPTTPPHHVEGQPMVFVEPSGSQYHAASCSRLKHAPIPIALYKAVTGFEWCSHCKPAR